MTKDKHLLQSELSKLFDEFIGLSIEDISKVVSINPELISKKSSVYTIVNRMLDYKNIDKKQLSKEVSVKTIRLQSNGIPKESMSFNQVDFMKLVEESWETSDLREMFSDTLFLFIVFQYKKSKHGQVLLFKGIKLWQMPKEDLDGGVKKLWEQTRRIVLAGVKLNEKQVGNKTIVENNLPGKTVNEVAHIRPKAKDGNDKIELPDGNMITRQAYWLNNSYIGLILKDMPEVFLKQPNQPSSNESRCSINDLSQLKRKLDEDAYPVEELIIKAQTIIPGFTELDVNQELVVSLGFNLEHRFIVKKGLGSIDHYLNRVIFSGSYFEIPQKPIFLTPYVQRKIDNYENDYKLLKIDDNLYITNKNLLNGGVTKQVIIDFKESVERYVDDQHFFTLRSLKESHFSHILEDYGFEDIFYESILMRPGRLKHLKVDKQFVFVKSKRNVTITDFVTFLLSDSQSISIEELLIRAEELCHLALDYDTGIRLMKNTSYYYSEELLKLYEDKEVYYKEIYE